MKKMSTFFAKNPNNLGRVINEVPPENDWVYEFGIPTRKFDGTSCAIIEGELYRRYDAKINKRTGKRKEIPEGAIPCQEADPHGSFPHWVKCDRKDTKSKYHFQAFDLLENKENGTYELCGEKVQGNPEKIKGHELIKHGSVILKLFRLDFEGIRDFLKSENMEGIVFHHKFMNDKKCKIRKSDFGLKR